MKNKSWWLAVAVLVGLLVRLYLAVKLSTWMDENTSKRIISLSFKEIMTGGSDLGHPPGYFLLLKGWAIISKKDVWLRISSVVFYLINCRLFYLIGKKKGAELYGRVLVLSYVLSGYFLTFDWQIRMYAGLMTMILWSLWLLETKMKKRKKGLLLIMVSVLGLFFDYGYLWYLVPLTGYLILSWKKYGQLLVAVGSSWLIFGVTWLKVFIANLKGGLEGIEWLGKYGFDKPEFFIPFFIGTAHRKSILLFLFLIYLFGAGILLWLIDKDKKEVEKIVMMGALVSLVVSFYATIKITPLLHVRSLQIVGLGVLLMHSRALTWIIDKKYYWLAGLVILGLVINWWMAVVTHLTHLGRMIA